MKKVSQPKFGMKEHPEDHYNRGYSAGLQRGMEKEKERNSKENQLFSIRCRELEIVEHITRAASQAVQAASDALRSHKGQF